MQWTAGIEIEKTKHVTLKNNCVAGSEKIGIRIAGENCTHLNSATSWSNNEVHSSLHGVHVSFDEYHPDCARVTGFYAWKNWDFGIYGAPGVPLMVTNCIVADNGNGMTLIVHSPPALSHERVDKYIEVRNSLIIGISPSFDCSTDLKKPLPATQAGQRGPRYGESKHIYLLSGFIEKSSEQSGNPSYRQNKV